MYIQPDFIQQIEQKVIEATVYDKSKSDEHGEVFTPPSLIEEMLDQLPPDSFTNPSKTFFDPCAGKGNFPILIVKRLMEGLQDEIKDEMERYKHIMEHQLFMSEYQDTSCDYIQEHFSLNGDVKINLHRGDTLKMSSNFFKIENTKKVKSFLDFNETKFDVVIGNPPYNDADFVRNTHNNQRTTNVTFYRNFIDKCKEWLTDNGVAAYFTPAAAHSFIYGNGFFINKVIFTEKEKWAQKTTVLGWIFSKKQTQCQVFPAEMSALVSFTPQRSAQTKDYKFRVYNFNQKDIKIISEPSCDWLNRTQGKAKWYYDASFSTRLRGVHTRTERKNFRTIFKTIYPITKKYFTHTLVLVRFLNHDWIFNRTDLITEQDVKDYYSL